jgi:hypothetical protein
METETSRAERRSDPSGERTGGLSPKARRTIFFAVLGLLIAGVGAAFAVSALRSGEPSQLEIRDRLLTTMAQAQSRAEQGNRRFDVTALRTQLGEAADGYIIDLAANEDRTVVGAAARQRQGTGCVLLWSTVGGPEAFSYDDPALPCEGEVALAAAAS